MSDDKPLVIGQDASGRIYNFDPATVRLIMNGVPISGIANSTRVEVDRVDADGNSIKTSAPPYWRMPPTKKWHDYDVAVERAEMTARKYHKTLRRSSPGWRAVQRALDARSARIRHEEDRRWRIENFVNADRLGSITVTQTQWSDKSPDDIITDLNTIIKNILGSTVPL